LSAAGMIALTFSHGSVFILAGMGVPLLITSVCKREKNMISSLGTVFGFWGITFLFWYLISYRGMFANPVFEQSTAQFFLPVNFWTAAGRLWLAENLLGVFRNPLDLSPPLFAALLFIVGVVNLGRKNPQKTWMLILPIVLALTASGWKKFPFHGRFLVFYLPVLIIFVANGIFYLSHWRKRFIPVLSYAFAVLLFIHPGKVTGQHFLKGYGNEELRPLMSHLKKHAKPGDAVYVIDQAHFAYLYYLGYFHFGERFDKFGRFSNDIFSKEKDPHLLMFYHHPRFNKEGNYAGPLQYTDIEKIYHDSPHVFSDNPRTWFVFSHAKDRGPKEFVLDYLRRHGIQKEIREEKGAALYLYDLSGTLP
jgi:hypothetical protein